MAGDPHWYDNVKLLLPMTGSNNSTTFTDLERVPKAVTAYGNAKIVTSQADPFGNYDGIGYFDGNGDYLSVAYSDDIDIAMSPFTIDVWIKPLSFASGARRIFAIGGGFAEYNATTGIHLLWQYDYTGKLNFQYWNGSTAVGRQIFTPVIGFNAWNHIEVSFDSSKIRQFINGIKVGETYSNPLRPSNNPSLAIGTIPGENGASATAFYGYMSDFRITKNRIRHFSNFTPPNARAQNYSPTISGILEENLAAIDFVAEAHQASDGAISGRTLFNGGSFTVNITTPENLHYVTVKPDMGVTWKASTAYALNGKVFPGDPVTKPYYYTATVAGTSGSTEPNWPTTPGQTVTDGTVTWECVERLVQPITHGPFIPS